MISEIFRTHVALHKMRDNLINTLNKFFTNQHQNGDNPVQMLVERLQEQTEFKMMNEIVKFITVDNHDAVEIGDLEKDPVVLLNTNLNSEKIDQM